MRRLAVMYLPTLPLFLLETKAAFANKDAVQKEVKAVLSEKATLSCEMSDTQTEVRWYKEGKLLSSSRKIHVESKGKSRQLVFDSVEKRDAGEYTCEAGAEKLVFKIQVEGMEGLSAIYPCLLSFWLLSLVYTCSVCIGLLFYVSWIFPCNIHDIDAQSGSSVNPNLAVIKVNALC